jgi:hypothetical protein
MAASRVQTVLVVDARLSIPNRLMVQCSIPGWVVSNVRIILFF